MRVYVAQSRSSKVRTWSDLKTWDNEADAVKAIKAHRTAVVLALLDPGYEYRLISREEDEVIIP